MPIPRGFLWGVSTSSYQFEGGNTNNQWHQWEQAGRIKTGERCADACDWWNNAERDLDAAQLLGVNALRMSIEWSRVQPRPEQWDTSAFQRYRTILKGLHARGMRPFVSLHHFTNPLWFEDSGAFLSKNADIVFEKYAECVVSELGDLCSDWVTINEPNVYASLGYQLGQFPPGKNGELVAAIKVLNNLCRAHARAYRAIHEVQKSASVGWAQHLIAFTPGSGTSWLDRMVCWVYDELFNRSFVRMVHSGRAPFPYNLFAGDMSMAKGTYDFVGINVYNRAHVAFDLSWPHTLFGRMYIPDDVPQGDPGFDAPYGEAYPRAITLGVEYVRELGKPIYVLENGVPDRNDEVRPWLLMKAAHELSGLIERGEDVRGYFHWSLVDNFEWSEGWGLRFGLLELNEKTQERTLRPSAQLYAEVIRSNGLSALEVNLNKPKKKSASGAPD